MLTNFSGKCQQLASNGCLSATRMAKPIFKAVCKLSSYKIKWPPVPISTGAINSSALFLGGYILIG